MKEINFENIPQELKDCNQWVLWKLETSTDKKTTKVPYTTKGYKANPMNPSTWSTFEDTYATYTKFPETYSGLGFVFSDSDPFVGIDWDHVRDNSSGFWDPEVLKEIQQLDTYAEISPSGTGAHAIVRGERDQNGKNKSETREIYDSKRFFTVTGNIIDGIPDEINDTNESFDSIQAKIGYKQTDDPSIDSDPISSTIEDDEIISRCRNAANREKFIELFKGNWEQYYESQSQADIALCGILAYRTQDESQIDRLARKSGLKRAKWDREDYLSITIRKAIEYVNSRNIWNGIALPNKYRIDGNGLYFCNESPKANTLICRTPVVVSAIGNDIDKDEFWYRITFKDPLGKLREEYVKQEDLTKRSPLLTLANKGINVTEKKAADLCEYFAESIHSNAEDLPCITFVQKNGWKYQNEMFVLGNRYYCKDSGGSVVQINNEEVKGLAKKGTLDNWAEGVEEIIAEPITRFKCYCAASSIILRLLGVQSYFVDHTGDTSTGKTISSKVAFSMLGNPDALKLAGNSTAAYLEHVASIFSDLPLFIDETSTQTSDNMKALVYIISNEVSKGRAKKDGGVRMLDRWKTVAFTTGEKPVTDADGFGGQQVRVIEIQKNMPYMPDSVEKVEDSISRNYGHIADLYTKKVFSHKDELISKFADYREHFTNNESGTMNRAGNNFAAIAVAGDLLEEVFDEIGIEVQDNLQLTESFFNETVKEKPIIPYPVKVLRAVNDWVEENRGYFIINENVENYRFSKKYGWITEDGYLDIIPSAVKAAMKNQGMNISSAIDRWIEDGILSVNQGRKDYKSTHFDENGDKCRPSVYRFDLNAMEKFID
ncbi:Uncharcterized protein, DUF927 family [Methanococcoides vulcani]|uniref:Uncharcterized protein, DUF927 family n=1 Tax=Methanococcoides vulcani TaxID=1353158 RepID=A0A1H9Y388_9EURY|nr:DUF927 domain-containing protein [Methanococcoides vulcani]SES63269.1 Uncharcterized protein, DUF927 family [Methanococcoides vulcani]